MITADSITDEQVVALRASLHWDDDEHDIIICDVALGVLGAARLGHKRYDRSKARAYCAEILNAQGQA